MDNAVIYEQPASELIRACLRLEHLFDQIDCYLHDEPEKHINILVRRVVDVIALLDRPDLKSKFTQETHRLINTLSKLHHLPHISHDKLVSTLDDLKKLLNYFGDTKGKIAQALRDNEFINYIRTHINTPGGDCYFDSPAYFYWSKQSATEQLNTIENWLGHFDQIRIAVDLMLTIMRTSAEERMVKAESGFYHEALSTQNPAQLIRVALPEGSTVYPEISVGKHRLNIRFYELNIDTRSKQTADDIEFELTTCLI